MTDTSFILWIQQFSNGFLDFFFTNITKVGNPEYYMIAIPLIYWCINKRMAFRFSLYFLASMYINSAIKAITDVDRPSGDQVRILYQDSTQGSSSFPSGHTQGTASFWGYMSYLLKRRWFTVLTIFIIASVALSRIYLGLHYPIDVVGGLFFAFAILILFNLFYDKVAAKIYSISFEKKIILSMAVSFALLLSPGHDTGMMAGFTMGLLIGYVLDDRYLKFETKGTLIQQIIKFVLGMVVFFALRIAIKGVFEVIGFNSFSELWADMVRYFIIGLWAAYLAPLTFIKLKLIDSNKQAV